MATRHPDETVDADTSARELMETVSALREELERLAVEKEHAAQGAVQAAADEITQLKATIAALRTEMETFVGAHADELAAHERAFRDERVQLTETVTELRSQLEAHDG